MALDANLYTLHFVRRVADPSTVDIVEASSKYTGSPLYIRQRARKSPIYDSLMLDGLLDEPLASVSAPASTAKVKSIRLQNPEITIELKRQAMTFAAEWRFDWEGSTYAWKRENTFGPGGPGKNEYSCWAIRSPDPNIWISIYKPTIGGVKAKNENSAGKGKGQELGTVEAFMQILDHNIARIEPTVQDRKGLELVILMSLSAILDQDYDEKYKTPAENMYLSPMGYSGPGTLGTQAKGKDSNTLPVESYLLKGRQRSYGGSSDGHELPPNEVPIEAWGEVSDYVNHCMDLLRDDGPAPSKPSESHGQNMSIIILKASSPETAQKAVMVAAGIKAAFYKLPDSRKGKDAGEELYQYLRSDEPAAASASFSKPSTESDAKPTEKPGGRPIIKLNAPPSIKASTGGNNATPASTSKGHASKPSITSNYIPPSSLTIYLSKERIAELEPKSKPAPRIPPKNALAPGSSSAGGGARINPAQQHRPPPPGFVPSGHGPPPRMGGGGGYPVPVSGPPPPKPPLPPQQAGNHHAPGETGGKEESLKDKLFGKFSRKG